MTNEEMKAIEAKGMRRLQKYVEQQCKEDEHLRDRYNPDLMERCWEWIREQVSNTARNGIAAVWHDNIYKLARDYFNDEIFKERPGKKTSVNKADKQDTKKELVAKPEETQAPKTEDIQMDLFSAGV